jgi:hypothetical protein
MSETDKKTSKPVKARGSRVPPVIDIPAIEVSASEIVSGQPFAEQGAETKTETLQKTSDGITQEQEAAKPITSGVDLERPELAVDAAQATPPSVQKRSLLLPMTVAALAGGVLGTLGGLLLSGVGSSDFIKGKSAYTTNDILTLQEKIKALEAKTAMPEVSELRQKVQGLEGALANKIAEAETRLSSRISTGEGALKELTARPAGPLAASVDLSPLTQRLGALEKDIKDLDGKTEAGMKAADPRIAAIAQQVDQATRRMSAANAAPFFSAVQSLSQTFQSGQPFATELTAVELLGGQAEQLAPLRGLSGKGAPTLLQIAASFVPLAGRLAQGDEKSEGWAWSILQRFARVRPAGQVGGSTPPDLVSTIEAALAKGDIQTALAAWRRLPETSRGPSLEWANIAEARDKAAKAVSAVQDAAISALRMAKP